MIADIKYVSSMVSDQNLIHLQMKSDQEYRVWIKAFWGFDPGNDGYLGFTLEGNREKFIENFQLGDLVLIYGADAPETDTADRRQALGFLEIDPIPIRDRERLSPYGLKRKIDNGWLERWTFAVPVRRAWSVNRRIEVKHLAPQTYTRNMARVIASSGRLLTPEETRNCLKLPVSPVNVFGEPPFEEEAKDEFAMLTVYGPSRGVSPVFGQRSGNYLDGDHFLYMLQMEGAIEAVLGRNPGSLKRKLIVKVGFSQEPSRRLDELNAALPSAGRLGWTLRLISRAYSDGQSAKDAEDAMKARFAEKFESLGGEFFLGDEAELVSEFAISTRDVAFHINITSQ